MGGFYEKPIQKTQNPHNIRNKNTKQETSLDYNANNF